MEWHINDLSLNGQFPSPQDFRVALETLLQLRQRDPLLRDNLYSSRRLSECPVTANMNLREAVTATQDKTFISLVLAWLGKSGPFWEEDRQPNGDDYFEFQGKDITNQGLGEAARRRLAGRSSNTFSFKRIADFETSPFTVQQGLAEDPLGYIEVINHWEIFQLEAELQTCRVMNCWEDLAGEMTRIFTSLIFSETVMAKMLATPFSKCVALRVLELLGVLEKIVNESDDAGHFSQTGMEILANHFAGEKAWFTDESNRNKRDFKEDMTFRDPDDATKQIFCPWHGKIKTPQTRIHFEWPRPPGQKKIKILFIGPKITKR